MPHPAVSSPRELVRNARRLRLDPRSGLLRLLVERYAAAGPHSAAEQQRFAALALRLYETADAETAIWAANELAGNPELPYAVALHLARGPIELAGPVLRNSPVLDEVTLQMLAETGTPAHAAAIAARREVSPALAKRIAAAMHAARDAAAIVQREAAESLPVEPSTPYSADPAEPPVRQWSPAHFLEAPPLARAAILDNLVTLPPLAMSERVPHAGAGTVARLEQAALRHQPAVFAGVLEKALGVSDETAAAIVADDSGEALVIACRVLGVPFDVVARILIFLNPAIGQSVARVFGLAELFESLPEASAQHLAAAWREAPRRAAGRSGEDAPSMRSFGEARRTGVQSPAAAAERRRRG